jgi:hypothetical protein
MLAPSESVMLGSLAAVFTNFARTLPAPAFDRFTSSPAKC